jgi:hypothetical protein
MKRISLFRSLFLKRNFCANIKGTPNARTNTKVNPDVRDTDKANKNPQGDEIKELNEDLSRLGNDWRTDVDQQLESHKDKHKDDIEGQDDKTIRNK